MGTTIRDLRVIWKKNFVLFLKVAEQILERIDFLSIWPFQDNLSTELAHDIQNCFNSTYKRQQKVKKESPDKVSLQCLPVYGERQLTHS